LIFILIFIFKIDGSLLNNDKNLNNLNYIKNKIKKDEFIEINSNKIKIEKLIGEGGYGKVFKGKYENNEIAIKQFNIEKLIFINNEIENNIKELNNLYFQKENSKNNNNEKKLIDEKINNQNKIVENSICKYYSNNLMKEISTISKILFQKNLTKTFGFYFDFENKFDKNILGYII
jgi:serine/threonine protein kinase